MSSLITLLRQCLPARFHGRRYLLDQYHFDLTSFHGDVSAWLASFPVCEANIEIYLALGELFRRQGEFDKAVAVHEAVINADVNGFSRAELELEVAHDYYAAGVLSHAEDVLIKTLDSADEIQAARAFRLWLAILESEQEWQRAVNLVEEHGVPGSGGVRLANLYCENIELKRRDKNSVVLLKELKKARKLGVSARAELLAAELLTESNRYAEAIQVYRDLMKRDAKRVDRILPLLERLSVVSGTADAFQRFLQQMLQLHPSIRIFERLVAGILKVQDELPETILSQLEMYAGTGDSYYLTELWIRKYSKVSIDDIGVLLPLLKQRSLINIDKYVCIDCGYYSDKNVWQCPQCLSWETLYSKYELKINRESEKSS